jgi:membrane protease YdiL (CAAX protease family)
VADSLAGSGNGATAPSGLIALGMWAALVMAGAAAWILVLAAWFRLPLSPEVFSGSVAVPGAARTTYVAGLYFWLMASAGWVWHRVGGRVSIGFSLRDWLLGWGVGLGGLAILSAVEILLGWARLGATPIPSVPAALGAFLVATAFGISEEALFRGFMLGLLRKAFAAMAAVWISAATFACLHFLRPVDPREILVPFVALGTAGALLAACRIRTGSLWLGIGIHSSWVWFITLLGQQSLLTFPVESRIWTGGGSPASGILGILGIGGLYVWLRRRFPEAEAA